jgi:hypothetical protein
VCWDLFHDHWNSSDLRHDHWNSSDLRHDHWNSSAVSRPLKQFRPASWPLKQFCYVTTTETVQTCVMTTETVLLCHDHWNSSDVCLDHWNSSDLCLDDWNCSDLCHDHWNSSVLLAATKPGHVGTNRPDAGPASAITSSPEEADAVRSSCATLNMGWSPLDMVQRHSGDELCFYYEITLSNTLSNFATSFSYFLKLLSVVRFLSKLEGQEGP